MVWICRDTELGVKVTVGAGGPGLISEVGGGRP